MQLPKDAYPLPHVKGLNVASEASHELAEQMNESRSTPWAQLRSPEAEYPALQEGWHEDPSGKIDGQDPESPFNTGPDAPLHEGPLDGVYVVPFIVAFVGGEGPPVGPFVVGPLVGAFVDTGEVPSQVVSAPDESSPAALSIPLGHAMQL